MGTKLQVLIKSLLTLSLLIQLVSNPTLANIMTQNNAAMISSFAPTGTLRVGINLGNLILASMNEKTQQSQGVTVDIANEIAQRLDLPIAFTNFKTAGATVEAVKNDEVDLVFVAIDPVRSADISYTPAYIQIEGAYMVKEYSP